MKTTLSIPGIAAAIARLTVATVLLGVSACCGFGFLASFELGPISVWHCVYGTGGAVALAAALWLSPWRVKPRNAALAAPALFLTIALSLHFWLTLR